MPAATYNFSIEQGSDLQVVFQYLNENNQFVNLTNFYVLLKFITDTGQIYSFDNTTETSDYSLTTDTIGQISLSIPARITNTYNFLNAVYDLDIQEPNEIYTGSGLKRYRFAQGNISIIKRNIPAIIQSDAVTTSNTPQTMDACEINCSSLDSVIYRGSSMSIGDRRSTVSRVLVQDNRPIDYVEVALNGLSHPYPQDLNVFLIPPSGDKILLSGSQKIKNYQPGFSCLLSDRALPNSSLYEVRNGGMCRITDKSHFVRYADSLPVTVCENNSCVDSTQTPPPITNNDNLVPYFSHLKNYIPSSGNWSLCIQDTDHSGSGILESWRLVITYIDLETED